MRGLCLGLMASSLIGAAFAGVYDIQKGSKIDGAKIRMVSRWTTNQIDFAPLTNMAAQASTASTTAESNRASAVEASLSNQIIAVSNVLVWTVVEASNNAAYSDRAGWSFQSGYATNAGAASGAEWSWQSEYATNAGAASGAEWSWQSEYATNAGAASGAEWSWQSEYATNAGMSEAAGYLHLWEAGGAAGMWYAADITNEAVKDAAERDNAIDVKLDGATNALDVKCAGEYVKKSGDIMTGSLSLGTNDNNNEIIKLTQSRYTNMLSIAVGWGLGSYGVTDCPVGIDYTTIAAGLYHSLALDTSGRLVAWGRNNYGQTNCPKGTKYVAIAAGGGHNVAIRRTSYGGEFRYGLVAWGLNYDGQTNCPAGTNYIAVSAGLSHSIALRSDGSIVGWGLNFDGQTNCPAGSNYVAIAAGGQHSLALRNEGTLVGWGEDDDGQTNCPAGSNYVAIAAGRHSSIALCSDGSLTSWPSNYHPAGTNYVAISAGYDDHFLALQTDGSIIGWGNGIFGQTNCPVGTNYTAIAAGTSFSLALLNGAIIIPYITTNYYALRSYVDGATNALDLKFDSATNTLAIKLDGATNALEIKLDGATNALDIKFDGATNALDLKFDSAIAGTSGFLRLSGDSMSGSLSLTNDMSNTSYLEIKSSGGISYKYFRFYSDYIMFYNSSSPLWKFCISNNYNTSDIEFINNIGYKRISIADPVSNYNAATKYYVDGATNALDVKLAGEYIMKSGGIMAGAIDMGSGGIYNDVNVANSVGLVIPGAGALEVTMRANTMSNLVVTNTAGGYSQVLAASPTQPASLTTKGYVDGGFISTNNSIAVSAYVGILLSGDNNATGLTLSTTVPFNLSIDAASRLNTNGAYQQYFQAGGAISNGQLVSPSTDIDRQAVLAETSDTSILGVWQDAAVVSGSWGWVTTQGKAQAWFRINPIRNRGACSSDTVAGASTNILTYADVAASMRKYGVTMQSGTNSAGLSWVLIGR